MQIASLLSLILTGGFALVSAAAVDPAPVGVFVSSKTQTYYSSRCSTASGSTSISPVPTRTTANANFPGVAISSTNTFTPITYTSTTTVLAASTVTVTAFAAPTPPAVKRQVDASASAGLKEIMLMNNSPMLKQNLTGRDLARRATYPTQVNCAVTTMVMTTSFFTATAPTRTAGVLTATAIPTTVVSGGGPFNLRLGAVSTYGEVSSLGKYFAIGVIYSVLTLIPAPNKAAATVFQLQPGTGNIITTDGRVLGQDPGNPYDPRITILSLATVATTNPPPPLLKASFSPVSAPNSYNLTLAGPWNVWWHCDYAYLAVELMFYGCPTYYVYAEGV